MGKLQEAFIKKYGQLTDIQEKAYAHIKNGENCIVIAPTGSGKTEAAVIPLLERLLESKDSGKDREGVKILYITPLRSLNRDLFSRLQEMCKIGGVSIAVRHGDTTQAERSSQLRNVPEFLITTPESLQAILISNYEGAGIKNVKAVVVDEIHELYYNKRGAQLSLGLERLERISGAFQRVGISATVGNESLISRFLCGDRSCSVIKSDTEKKLDIKVALPEEDRLSADISKSIGVAKEDAAKIGFIIKEIKNANSVIIFTNTRQMAESLSHKLASLPKSLMPFETGVHHSSLDRDERIETEKAFKEGNMKSIVATSSLELGIDIGKVDLVIQYGSPRQPLRLIQRVGRGGHKAGEVSKGIIIATDEADAMEALAIAGEVHKKNIDAFCVQAKAMDVLANQICGLALDCSDISVENVLSIIRGSYLYKDISNSELKELLEFMASIKMIRYDGTSIYATGRTKIYYYTHLSLIPDSKKYLVKDFISNKAIATLDEKFVAAYLSEGVSFISKGVAWKVVSIEDKIIKVERSSDIEAAIPDWEGEDIPVSRQTVKDVLSGMASGMQQLEKFTLGSTREKISKFLALQGKSFLFDDNSVIVENLKNGSAIYAGLGSLGNAALARFLSYLLASSTGEQIVFKSTPYMIFFENVDGFALRKALETASTDAVEKLMRYCIEESDIFLYVFAGICKNFGIIEKKADVSKTLVKKLKRIFRDTCLYKEALRSVISNYYDIDSANAFVKDVHENIIKVKFVNSDKPSPFSALLLSSAFNSASILEELPANDVAQAFEENLLEKNVRLLCTYCGFSFTRKLKELKDAKSVSCPSCGSKMLSIYNEEYEKVLEKRKARKKLSKHEISVYNEMAKTASIIAAGGGRAILALSVYGIGPTSASRALYKSRDSEIDFIKDLITLQRQFIKTKKYWKT
ncbi:MAG: DEAD/DEAH box helicase [Candidatus Micrarchaeia archaeon]